MRSMFGELGRTDLKIGSLAGWQFKSCSMRPCRCVLGQDTEATFPCANVSGRWQVVRGAGSRSLRADSDSGSSSIKPLATRTIEQEAPSVCFHWT